MFKHSCEQEEEEEEVDGGRQEDTLPFSLFVIISILTKVWPFVLIKNLDKDVLCQDWRATDKRRSDQESTLEVLFQVS